MLGLTAGECGRERGRAGVAKGGVIAGEMEARAGLEPGLRTRPRSKAGDAGLTGRVVWAVVRVGEPGRVRWDRVEGVVGADIPGLVLPLDGKEEGDVGGCPFPAPLPPIPPDPVPPGPGPEPAAPLTPSAKTSFRHLRTKSLARRYRSWLVVLRRMSFMCLPNRVDWKEREMNEWLTRDKLGYLNK